MSLPARLGRLRRVEAVGWGGFATVWRYHDEDLRSDVAVKALADNWARRHDVRQRFLEEARILRRADSDHVVRVHDLGEVDGTPYFVMTYADRGPLAARLTSGEPSDPGWSLDMIEQAASGLSVLHAAGVLHRDVKPQNLLLRSDGDGERLLVADLGVAKALLHASGLTQVVGTPAYMAPEQAFGEALDVRADVHALAAVAYQMLTGRLVREGGYADLREIKAPAAPSSVADLPVSVDDVLLRALAIDPEDRWPDVVSFVAALRAGMPALGERRIPLPQGVNLPAGDPESGTASAPPAGPSARLLALLVVGVLVVTTGASFGLVTLLR